MTRCMTPGLLAGALSLQSLVVHPAVLDALLTEDAQHTVTGDSVPTSCSLRLTTVLGRDASWPVASVVRGGAAQQSPAMLLAVSSLAARHAALPPDEPAPAPGAIEQAARFPLGRTALEHALSVLLAGIVVTTLAYAVRHAVFTFSRLLGRQRHPYSDVDTAEWPQVTVLIAAHNEEKVVAGCIEALLDTDYPRDRLRIVPVNDRSSDGTRPIIDRYASRHPELIHPFHRCSGKPGKAAALKDALEFVRGDIVIVFDADYLPGKAILRRLVAPFFDPEVGAVMGRVVPVNAGTNLLTRMLDLERAAGYQVDQQARMNLGGVPQYGGTVGGVRQSAVESSGGWRDDVLAEDTDITFRLLIAGWKTVYVNRAECYEEVPEEWSVRIRQVSRWAKGHNQVLHRCWRPLLASPFLSLRERVDGAMLLLVFAVPPLLLAGWVLALLLYYLGAGSLLGVFIPVLVLTAYGTLGNFATFMEIVGGLLLDGNVRRVRLLPLNLLCFVVSLFAITRALGDSVLDGLLRRELVWHKTLRYRSG